MDDPSRTIVRRIGVPPARVYAAWLSPNLLARWWCPDDGRVTAVEVDRRVDGALWIAFENEDGSMSASCNGLPKAASRLTTQ